MTNTPKAPAAGPDLPADAHANESAVASPTTDEPTADVAVAQASTADAPTACAGAADTPTAGGPDPNPNRRPRRKSRADDPGQAPSTSDASPNAHTTNTAPRSGSKIAGVIALLAREEGATLAELVEATGWLPHTTRAALTGLRKKGYVIEKVKRGDATCYRIVAEMEP